MNTPFANPTIDTSKPLSGQVALVTGSTSGIGLGIASALADAGAAIVLNGLGDAQEIQKTCNAIARKSGAAVTFNGADISSGGEISAMIRATEAEHGRLDILVNNAGIQHVAPLEDFPVEKWNAVLAINLSGAFHAMRAAIPGMKARGFGRIVNIASAHGLVGSPFKSAYVAAKHGIVGLTKVAALETGEHGITVNAVCPGYVWTPLVEKQIDEQAAAHGIPREEVVRDILLKKHPNKRFATVEELGQIVTFLASQAAASITGTQIAVDGGWTAE